MLEVLYMVALIVGGGLVLVSSFAGSVGPDIDADVDADIDVDAHIGADLDAHVDAPDLGGLAVFLKFKFWTFFLAFSGLTGFVLLKIGLAALWTIAPALLMGILCGFLMSWSLEVLKRNQRGSHASVEGLIGREALVLVPIKGQIPGRVRISYGGRNIDMIAVSEIPEPIEAGDPVVIVATEGGKLRVVTRAFLSVGEEAP